MSVPARPKIYHIVHYDRLNSIMGHGELLCDIEIERLSLRGTCIGMSSIKQRRREGRKLDSRKNLLVGECVPFYFCPRSVMLYLIHRNNPDLEYQGGQANIIHLEADMYHAVQWAERNNLRWAFTDVNAAACYANDHCDLSKLDVLDWRAIATRRWSGPGVPADVMGKKQAEFLIERRFSWELVDRIGVRSGEICGKVRDIVGDDKVPVEIISGWYY